jgi:uncharacterized membrane protein YczE
MRKRLIKLILANTLASFAITCVVKSGLGYFSTTAANLAIANWTGMTVGMAGMIIELIMLLIATWKGEGIGWTSIINATYGSLLIDVFIAILPESPFMITGLALLPIAWSAMGSVGLGENGANTLMNAILKHSRLNITVIRSIQEFILLTIGFLGAREHVTLLTIALVFSLGPLLQIVYKWIGFDPTKVKHKYLIKLGNKKISVKNN